MDNVTKSEYKSIILLEVSRAGEAWHDDLIYRFGGEAQLASAAEELLSDGVIQRNEYKDTGLAYYTGTSRGEIHNSPSFWKAPQAETGVFGAFRDALCTFRVTYKGD
jgi:hypothetical protein